MKKNFGQKVKYYRRMRDLSQEQLAELMDMQTTSISFIENGKNFISFSKFDKLCKALNVEPYQFFLFDKRDEKNADKVKEIADLAGTLNKRDLELVYKIIFEIASSPKK